ncbi:MAG: hypothetical protein LBK59_02830 [Bifidobacteriaceae bacterium]|nr:hypothetical protein [Bifidobacteriaceae bacterium]
MTVATSRVTGIVVAGAALMWAVAGCVDAGGPAGEPAAGSSASPRPTVAAGDLYGASDPSSQALESPLPSAPSPAKPEDSEPPAVTGPPPEPTSGPDTGIPYGADGELVRGADEIFSLTDAEQHVVDQAHALLVSDCLKAEGFTDVIRMPTMPTPGSGVAEWDETMGLIRAESARYGYLGDPQITYSGSDGWGISQDVPVDERKKVLDAMMECQRSTASDLGLPAEGDLPWDIKHAAQAEASADPTFIEAVEGWSQCMASEGYIYARPTEPWTAAPWSYPDCQDGDTRPECAGDAEATRPALSALEIATAEADLACKAEVSMVPVFRAAMWTSQQAQIDANRPTLDQRLDTEKARLHRAQELLRVRGGT